MLLEIGKWLKVNGEAIYGTRPWRKFGEGPTKSIGGDHIDSKLVPYASEDFRFTTKGAVLYAIPLVLPEGELTIRSLTNADGAEEVAAVELVGSSEEVKWSQGAERLTIEPVRKFPSSYAAVYRIKFRGTAD